MSQGDYIRYKRISTELTNESSFPPVLTEQDYINYKQYSIENTIVSTKPDYRIPSFGTQIIFDMNKKVNFCPPFITCTNTNMRPNRVPMSTVYFTPQYVTKYVKHPTYEKTGCDCIQNSVNTDKNICKCKTKY